LVASGRAVGKGAGFVSLKENIDTTTAGGRLVFHMMFRLPSSSAT